MFGTGAVVIETAAVAIVVAVAIVELAVRFDGLFVIVIEGTALVVVMDVLAEVVELAGVAELAEVAVFAGTAEFAEGVVFAGMAVLAAMVVALVFAVAVT